MSQGGAAGGGRAVLDRPARARHRGGVEDLVHGGEARAGAGLVDPLNGDPVAGLEASGREEHEATLALLAVVAHELEHPLLVPEPIDHRRSGIFGVGVVARLDEDRTAGDPNPPARFEAECHSHFHHHRGRLLVVSSPSIGET